MVVDNMIMQSKYHELLEENYNAIIKMLNEVDISLEKLDIMKYDFKEEVASKRIYESIKTIEQLLKVLEARDVISCENIGKLYDIVHKLDQRVQQNVGKYLIRQTQWLSKVTPKVHLAYFPDNKFVDYTKDEFFLPNTVIDCISSQITRSWKQLARALKIIKEKDIDKIEELSDAIVNCTNIKTKKCLEIYVHEVQHLRLCNPYDTLLKALEIIGRRDVKESVERLLRSMSV